MFRKILIANRGEIAVRIIRTCRKLGINTVAIYSEPDLKSQHVIYADEAYNIGPGQPSESYLNIPKIVKVAKTSKAEAVHPGYGFLAENPQFARECEEAGLIFIGPRSKILASAANKFGSRETADRAGVPTIPGSKRQLETADEAENEARRLGFPVLIKASFGGGGRGMRIVKATKYENAGTVEFVQSAGGKFYYLETNKRIQVEHLITEMVTGVDIVEQQIRTADGEGLGFSQEEIEFNGAAMNCRINAEDPSRGFAPSPGRVEEFVPPGGPGIRVDTAMIDGAVIPEYYDSLIAKIASHGRTREEAIQRLKGALSETIVIGLETTIPLHQTILEDKDFVCGDYHTQLLDNKISTWNFKPQLSKEEIAMLHFAANHPFLGTSKSKLERTQTRWRNTLQTEPSPRQPLFVEGL